MVWLLFVLGLAVVCFCPIQLFVVWLKLLFLLDLTVGFSWILTLILIRFDLWFACLLDFSLCFLASLILGAGWPSESIHWLVFGGLADIAPNLSPDTGLLQYLST